MVCIRIGLKKVSIFILVFLSFVGMMWADICEIPPQLPPVIERIENRVFPSIFQAWDKLVEAENLTPPQPWEAEYTERLVLHDLHFTPFFSIWWHRTLDNPYYGLSTLFSGNLEASKKTRQQRLALNPNMVFLFEVRLHNHFELEAFSPDSNFWLGAESGALWDEHLIDILNPEVQQLHIDRIVGVAKCGLYDGVMLDGFYLNATGFVGNHQYTTTDEELIQAHVNILKGVRERVRDDFLILANASDTKMTRYAEYVNGAFMEIGSDHPDFYSDDRLQHLEDVLLWNERNLRSPQINSFRARGFGQYPPDGPENRQWMRIFTTMSLTHSDGYFLYVTGRSHFLNGVDAEGQFIPHQEHIWYRFYDAPLGRPIGGDETKGIVYETPKGVPIDGLFIREFTNGWAVYNRSGKARRIYLPEKVSSWHSNVADKHWHVIPDLDGEIYLKNVTPVKHFADVNNDGVVNILDLVLVANGFNGTAPDINGDGIVNVLDLVLVSGVMQ